MENLLDKLRSKFSQSKKEMAKRIGAIALAGTLALGAAGCSNIISTSPNGTRPNSSTNEQNKGKYSELLQNVLNDEYYNSLLNTINSAQSLEEADEMTRLAKSPAYDPHPYAFLENQGIDVDKILDGTYDAYTMSYVLNDEPNNLYIHTRVLVDDEYYVSYLITYKLTDKEMSDYKMMHGSFGGYNSAYQHCVFLNDKISEMKEPTKVLSTKYTKQTHEVFTKYLNASYEKQSYIIPQIDLDNTQYYYIQYPKHLNKDIAIEKKSIFFANFKDTLINSTNNIFAIHDDYDNADLLDKETKDATAFFSQEIPLLKTKNAELLNTK